MKKFKKKHIPKNNVILKTQDMSQNKTKLEYNTIQYNTIQYNTIQYFIELSPKGLFGVNYNYITIINL